MPARICFGLLCLTLVMTLFASAQTTPQVIKADPGNNNPPPPGAILDLSGTPVPGGGNGTYQGYMVSFTATLESTAITFALREDPAFLSLANVSVVDLTANSGNLLMNGDFSLGFHTENGNSAAPNDWTYANTYGATYGGIVESGASCGVTYNYCFYDGAVQAYDAISQTISTIVGHTYQISFYLADNSDCQCNFSDLSTNGDTSDTGGNGINVTVYAQGGLPPASTQQGQTINPGSPTGLAQQFVFVSTPGQQIQLDFDFTHSFDSNTITVAPNTNPSVSDQGLTHENYASMVNGTSLATTDCSDAPGQGLEPNGRYLCSQLTLTCTNQNSNQPSGDNCPTSQARDLYFDQQLSTPGTGLAIPPGTGPVLAMGGDTWAPGKCVLTGQFSGKLCPQNVLTSFALFSLDNGIKPGGTTGNSSYVAGAFEPEWNTVPQVPAWYPNTSVPVSFTANPPNPNCTGTGCNGWVAAPNQSITWGVENVNSTPDTTYPVQGDTTFANTTPCPTSWPAPGTVPSNATANGTVTVAGPGTYEVHFFSTACDGQEELVFPASVQTATGQNVAMFKTVSFGVTDSTPPTISTPVLSGGLGNNTFAQGSNAMASFTCSDAAGAAPRSGLAGCGRNVLPISNNALPQTQSPRSGPAAGALSQTVSNYAVPTSTLGPQTFKVYATNYAGLQSSASVSYCVGYNVVSTDGSGNVGFTQPVLNPGSGSLPNINSVTVKQAIPMQLTVTDCNGNPVTNLGLAPPNGTGTVVLSAYNQTVCSVASPDNSISTAAAGNSGWQNLGGGTYQYNWKPYPNHGACLSFQVNLGDGVQRIAYFSFK